MNRRELLQFLAALPLTGLLPKEAPAAIEAPPIEPTTIQVFTDWKEMAAALWKNAEAYVAQTPDQWDEYELRLMQPICYRFCHALLEREETQGPSFGAHSMAAALHPETDVDLVQKNVTFGVTTAPVTLFEGQAKPTLTRRLRLADAGLIRVLMEDLRVFHGVEAEVEMVSLYGMEAAVEVLAEVRHDWKNGCRTRMYALHLPPFLTTVDPKMAEDFSVDRRWRMRYAKFA